MRNERGGEKCPLGISIHKKKKKCVRILYAPVLFITHYALSLSVLLSLVANAVHCIASCRPLFSPSIQEPETRNPREKKKRKQGYLTVFLHIICASKHRFALPTEKGLRNHHTRRPLDAGSSQQKPSKQRASSAASAPSRAQRTVRAHCHGCCHRYCSVCCCSRHSHRGIRKRENPKHRPRSSSSHCANHLPLQTYATVHALAIVMAMAGPSTSSPSPPAPPCPYSHSRQSCQTHHYSSCRSCDYPAFPTA